MDNNKIPQPFASSGFTLASLAAAVMAFSASSAIAGETIDLGDETTLNWSLTTSYGVGMRLSDRDKKLLNNINGDDGNRNFDRHSLTTNRVGALAELLLDHKNYGGVLRASTYYDQAYHASNDNNSPTTVNKYGSHDEFTDDTQRMSGGNSRILDAYVYGNFDLPSEQRLSVRAGKHLIAWGESLFYPGVNGVQSPVDVVKAGQPGVETKEVLLPVGQVSASWEATPDLGFSAYYQYEWKGNELNPVGSYLSTSDVTGPGREFLLIDPGFGLPLQKVNYAGTNDPRDSGEYGVRVMFRPFGQWEFGLFNVRYHDRNPSGITLGGFGGNPISPRIPTTYEINYFEDITLTGASFSTLIGETQIGGEWSYRDNVPINVMTNAGPQPVKGSGQQMQLSFIRTLGAAPWASSTTLLGEVVHVQADGVDSEDGLGTDYTYDQGNNWQTKSSTAFTLSTILGYPGAFSGWDLNVPISFAQVVDGRTPMQGTISAGQGDQRLAIGATLKRLGNLELNTTYTNYLSSPSLHDNRVLTDRDNITLSAKYTF